MTKTHRLWKTGEEGCPKVICDTNDEVVLDLCKICGKGEADLGPECPLVVSDASVKLAEEALSKAKQLARKASPRPNLLTWCLRRSLHQLYGWLPYY